MSRRAWWLGAVACLIVLPVSALSVAVVRLDPNDYKPAIIEAVQDATGRTLSLNGPLRVSRSLWPTIEARDVALANLPGGTRPDMARAERIEASLSLPALLRHRIEVTRLTLVGPNILFEQVAGKSNWMYDPPGRAAVVPASTPGTPFQLRIRSTYVQNGMVTWRLPARTKVLGIRSLNLRHGADDGPLEAEAVLVYSDNQPFSLKAKATPTAGIAGPWSTRLDFAAYDAAASATGTMDVAGHYDLQVEAVAGALAQLNALLPDMRLPALRQATLSAHVANGRRPGDLPVIGATRLQFAGADLGDRVRGLRLGASSVVLPAAGALATVASAGHLAGQPFSLAGTVGVPMHPDERASLPIDVKAQAVPTGGKAASGSIALKGKLALSALSFEGLDAMATLSTPALAALRPVLTQALPALTGVTFDGQVVVPANAGSVRFTDARLRAREGDLAGDGTVGLGTAMVLDAKLRSGKLDMDALLEAFGMKLTQQAARADTTGPMIPDTPLPWHVMRGPTIDVAVGIDAMTFQGQVWQAVELALQLKGGRLRVGTAKVALPGGPLALSMTADASASAVPVSLSVHGPAVPLALAARYAGLPAEVSGNARIDVQLHGMGRTVRDLATSLDGPFLVTATGGQLSNASFIKLASASLDALGIKVPPQGETALRCLGLIGSFNEGVGRFRTIALETTYLSLEGVGQVDLGRETVAFQLHPLAQVSGSPVSVPVVVEGPFRAISGRLDATSLEKLGLMFEAWSGGDQPTACADAGLVPGLPKRR